MSLTTQILDFSLQVTSRVSSLAFTNQVPFQPTGWYGPLSSEDPSKISPTVNRQRFEVDRELTFLGHFEVDKEFIILESFEADRDLVILGQNSTRRSTKNSTKKLNRPGFALSSKVVARNFPLVTPNVIPTNNSSIMNLDAQSSVGTL